MRTRWRNRRRDGETDESWTSLSSFLSFRVRLRHSRSLRERRPVCWSGARMQHAPAAPKRHAENISRNLSSFWDGEKEAEVRPTRGGRQKRQLLADWPPPV